MAVVRLSDAVIPAVYLAYQGLNTPELTAIWQSGLVATSPVLDEIARSGGKTAVIPFWNDLDSSIEPNYSNDDPSDFAVPNKLGSGQMECRKAWMNQAYASMDIIVELSGSEPMTRIRDRFSAYWQRQWQRRAIATLIGLYRANVAQDAGDMVVDISGEALPADQIFNADAVIDANGTMGDASGQFSAIMVHSAVHTRMLKNNEIIYIQDSVTGLNIPYYKGLRVIMDDGMPVLSGTGTARVFLSVLMGGGAFGYGGVEGHAFAAGAGIPKVAMEIDRTPLAGNGGGEEMIIERKTQILHPNGFTWVEGTGADAPTEFSPALADLAMAKHWDRVVSRKQTPFAFVVSKA